MTPEAIECDFKAKVGREVRLLREAERRYRILTPFVLDDGDHLAIVLKQEGQNWILSDEGSTLMRLADHDDGHPRRETGKKVVSDLSRAFCVEDRDGELILPIADDRYGDALYSFSQALLKITSKH